jgi:hypothetical protein
VPILLTLRWTGIILISTTVYAFLRSGRTEKVLGAPLSSIFLPEIIKDASPPNSSGDTQKYV